MTQQIQSMTHDETRDYADEPYEEAHTQAQEEDGARLASPGMFKRKIARKVNRGSGRTKSDNKKRKSINMDKNANLNSYFNHIQAQAANKGYTSLAKGLKSNDREMQIK